MSIALIIFQGPSASGKTTIQAKLGWPRIITRTSRAPRPGELDGRDYFFVDKAQMLHLYHSGKMIEMTEYQGNYYGTTADSIHEVIEGLEPKSIVMDAQGARAIKALYADHVLLIGVYAEKEQCRQRLLSRNISEEALARRMSTYEEEVAELSQCDMVLMNTDGNFAKVERIVECLREGLGRNHDIQPGND